MSGGSATTTEDTGVRRNCDLCCLKKVKCDCGHPCSLCRYATHLIRSTLFLALLFLDGLVLTHSLSALFLFCNNNSRKGIDCVYSAKRKPGPKTRGGLPAHNSDLSTDFSSGSDGGHTPSKRARISTRGARTRISKAEREEAERVEQERKEQERKAARAQAAQQQQQRRRALEQQRQRQQQQQQHQQAHQQAHQQHQNMYSSAIGGSSSSSAVASASAARPLIPALQLTADMLASRASPLTVNGSSLASPMQQFGFNMFEGEVSPTLSFSMFDDDELISAAALAPLPDVHQHHQQYHQQLQHQQQHQHMQQHQQQLQHQQLHASSSMPLFRNHGELLNQFIGGASSAVSTESAYHASASESDSDEGALHHTTAASFTSVFAQPPPQLLRSSSSSSAQQFTTAPASVSTAPGTLLSYAQPPQQQQQQQQQQVQQVQVGRHQRAPSHGSAQLLQLPSAAAAAAAAAVVAAQHSHMPLAYGSNSGGGGSSSSSSSNTGISSSTLIYDQYSFLNLCGPQQTPWEHAQSSTV
jgi:hypothetical protein